MNYEDFVALLTYNLPFILGGMIVVVVTLIILSIVLLVSNRKLKSRYNIIMKDTDKGSIEDMIKSYQNKINESYTDVKIALQRIDSLNQQMTHCVQKVGVVRYQAFEDVGSDLSYSVALLDEKNDGVVITSIFGRNMSTSYAKPISKGTSKYAFSEEEKFAMNKALDLEYKLDSNMKKKKAH